MPLAPLLHQASTSSCSSICSSRNSGWSSRRRTSGSYSSSSSSTSIRITSTNISSSTTITNDACNPNTEPNTSTRVDYCFSSGPTMCPDPLSRGLLKRSRVRLRYFTEAYAT